MHFSLKPHIQGNGKCCHTKKAIPRIALEAEAKNDFKLDLQIVPVGITYNHYWKFNRSLIIQYGQPIQVKDYWIDYELNSQKAMLDLRDEIHRKLVSLILQINSKTSYLEIENIRQLVGKEYSQRRYFCKDPRLQLFYSEKELVSKLELLEELQPEHFQNIIAATRQYFSGIEKDDISDDQIENAEKACWSKVFSSLTLAVLALPIFVFGFVFNAVPFVILRTNLRKKVKDAAFLSTFNFVGGLILFPLFYLNAVCVLFSWSDSVLVALFTLVGMPFSGKIAYQLFIFYRIILQKISYLVGSKSHKNTIKSLLEQRNGLIALILEKVNF